MVLIRAAAKPCIEYFYKIKLAIKPNCSPKVRDNLNFALVIFNPDLYLQIILFLKH